MEKLSLAALLDEDREMTMANIAADRTLPAAQAALEKAVDRVMYRYMEAAGEADQRDSAQHILQAVKNTLPIMDVVGEARIWKKQYEPERGGAHITPLAGTLLAAGLVLVLASVLGTLIAGRGAALAFVKALLPTAAGCGCLYFAGLKSVSRGRKDVRSKSNEAQERTEYLVDAEKAWHCLRGAMLQADGQLERIRDARAGRAMQPETVARGPLDAAELDLFAELLETAYASDGEGAREAASAIRFYLHGAQVEVVDYSPERAGWFEFLPASKPGTIRPALTTGDRLLRKGMASAKR